MHRLTEVRPKLEVLPVERHVIDDLLWA